MAYYVLQAPRGLQQKGQVNTCLETHQLERVHDFLRAHVAGSAGGVWAAADPAQATCPNTRVARPMRKGCFTNCAPGGARKPTGAQRYEAARRRAREMGWVLNMDLPGHRVSDFPHAAIHTGALADYQESPSSMRWILEIHLTDPQGRFGAFFEDMLLEDGDYMQVPA